MESCGRLPRCFWFLVFQDSGELASGALAFGHRHGALNTHTQHGRATSQWPRCTCTCLLMWPFMATWEESQVTVSRGPLSLRLVTTLQACCCLPVLGGGQPYIIPSPRPVGPHGDAASRSQVMAIMAGETCCFSLNITKCTIFTI